MEERAATPRSVTSRSGRARPPRRRRVLIEDARGYGRHLRTTWHAETRQFVVSTWNHDVCTGSAQLDADGAAELAALLIDGLADAATLAEASPAMPPPSRAGLTGFVDRLRWLLRGTAPTARAARPQLATVRPLRTPGT